MDMPSVAGVFDVGQAARTYMVALYEELVDEAVAFEEMSREPSRHTLEEWDQAYERLAELRRQTETLMQELGRFGFGND